MPEPYTDEELELVRKGMESEDITWANRKSISRLLATIDALKIENNDLAEAVNSYYETTQTLMAERDRLIQEVGEARNETYVRQYELRKKAEVERDRLREALDKIAQRTDFLPEDRARVMQAIARTALDVE